MCHTVVSYIILGLVIFFSAQALNKISPGEGRWICRTYHVLRAGIAFSLVLNMPEHPGVVLAFLAISWILKFLLEDYLEDNLFTPHGEGKRL